jgi:hypothetical protein
MTNSQDTETDRPTLGDASHTNPFTGEAFGETQTYDRGKTVAADGGTANSTPTQSKPDDAAHQLRDIDHTPPPGAESANDIYARGGEAGLRGKQIIPENDQ